MIMSIRTLKYGKKIGFILAGVLIGVCSGISSVSAAEELGSSRARAGIKRPAANRAVANRAVANRAVANRAVANRAAFNRPAVRPIAPIAAQRPFVRPIINPVVVDVNVEENPCVVDEAFIVIKDACVVVNNEED